MYCLVGIVGKKETTPLRRYLLEDLLEILDEYFNFEFNTPEIHNQRFYYLVSKVLLLIKLLMKSEQQI